MDKLIVYLKQDMRGTYFVSANWREDDQGNIPNKPYTLAEKVLRRKLDDLHPHLPLMAAKKFVIKEARKAGFKKVVIKVEP